MRKCVPLLLFCLVLLLGRELVFAAAKPKTTEPPQLLLPVSGELSSLFGMRGIPGGRTARMHRGVDFAAETGTPVHAAAPGKVSFTGVKGGHGLMVEITHDKGLVTRYAHLDTCAVAVDDQVASGDRIGTVGESGRTKGANLHFETMIRGGYVNPLPLLGLNRLPVRFANWSPVMRPKPGVFARFKPQSRYETLLAPKTLPVPATTHK